MYYWLCQTEIFILSKKNKIYSIDQFSCVNMFHLLLLMVIKLSINKKYKPKNKGLFQ